MVDLEQFREAVECWHDAALPANDVEAERKAEAKRLLSIIDSAGKVASAEPVAESCANHEAGETGYCHFYKAVPWQAKLYLAPPQPAPVVDEARMARALEWVRVMAMQDADGSHVSAIQEAIAAYDPNCGARTVRLDDALRKDAERYRWMRKHVTDAHGNYRDVNGHLQSFDFDCEGDVELDAAIDAAMKGANA